MSNAVRFGGKGQRNKTLQLVIKPEALTKDEYIRWQRWYWAYYVWKNPTEINMNGTGDVNLSVYETHLIVNDEPTFIYEVFHQNNYTGSNEKPMCYFDFEGVRVEFKHMSHGPDYSRNDENKKRGEALLKKYGKSDTTPTGYKAADIGQFYSVYTLRISAPTHNRLIEHFKQEFIDYDKAKYDRMLKAFDFKKWDTLLRSTNNTEDGLKGWYDLLYALPFEKEIRSSTSNGRSYGSNQWVTFYSGIRDWYRFNRNRLLTDLHKMDFKTCFNTEFIDKVRKYLPINDTPIEALYFHEINPKKPSELDLASLNLRYSLNLLLELENDYKL